MCVLNIGIACIMSAQLTTLDVGYNNTLDKTAYSYDGEARDISKFYTDKQTNFNIGGYINIDRDKEIEFYYDNGINTDKYNKGDTISLSYSQSFDDLTLTLHGTTYGDENHTPCYDTFDREYYCSTLTAYNEDINEKNNYNIGITINHKF